MVEVKRPLELSVGELARRSGLAVSTIHFYESKGLIRGWRSVGNQRRYPRGMLRRVAIIKVAQRAGVSLAEVAAALAHLPQDRAPSREDWAGLSAAWKADLDRRIERLTRLRDQLSGCIGCGCLSLQDCPLRNPDDALGREGPGPRILDPSGG
ncbi:MAG TPA: redox-sensitive transcriptional activator SoxR [Caulobacteraceae bacterium]|jgi:MerR family redox-sensitive transcriptional activator SoxR|nr:redox-sensitive transcriptional activator SoxR [Caulobacteraceae bacterium]